MQAMGVGWRMGGGGQEPLLSSAGQTSGLGRPTEIKYVMQKTKESSYFSFQET